VSHILTVSGSPAEVSRSAKLLEYVSVDLAGLGHTIEHVDVRKLPPEAMLHADFTSPELKDAAEKVLRADGLVVATPVYKASYSGVLKSWLDMLPQFALEGKTVLPLATGGSVAHALALDYALRPVLMSMGARQVVQGYLVIEHLIETVGESGVTRIDDDALDMLDRVVRAFCESLPLPRSLAVVGPAPA
jgi:FMN reductase